jgi:hypothetical protein
MDRDQPNGLTFRERLGLAARRLARRLGWAVLWIVLVALFLWKAPIIPFSPTCSQRSFHLSDDPPQGFSRDLGGDKIIIEGPMSTAFVDEFTEFLNWWGVSYLRIGNNVFISFWDELSGANDGLINSNDKTLRGLGHRLREPDAPPDIRERAVHRVPDISVPDDCLLARAVAIENWGRGG